MDGAGAGKAGRAGGGGAERAGGGGNPIRAAGHGSTRRGTGRRVHAMTFHRVTVVSKSKSVQTDPWGALEADPMGKYVVTQSNWVERVNPGHRPLPMLHLRWFFLKFFVGKN